MKSLLSHVPDGVWPGIKKYVFQGAELLSLQPLAIELYLQTVFNQASNAMRVVCSLQ